jgi:predicted GH43/DUF377 family glycosyl hydrolase
MEDVVEKLGDGEVIKLASGELIFKLASYPENPIVKPEEIGLTWEEEDRIYHGAVFNPGATIFQNQIILTPRCHKNYYREEYFDEQQKLRRYRLVGDYISEIWVLISEDGVRFKRFKNTIIKGAGASHQDFQYGIEDIRIVEYEDGYLLVGCGKLIPPFKGTGGDRIAFYTTRDFLNITYRGIVSTFDSRNAIPFCVGNEWYIFLRFHPNIHLTPLSQGLEQILEPKRYLKLWNQIYQERAQNLLFKAGEYPHEKEKIGPSTPVIKTRRGLLFIYHGVGEIDLELAQAYGLSEPIKRGYSISAAILDEKNPYRVLARTKRPLYIPSKPYEFTGNATYPLDVPFVVFPVGSVVKNDKLLLYCGAGDKYIILLSCGLEKLLDYLFSV